MQVLGNMHGGRGKKSRTRGESDGGSGVPSWAQEVPWSDGVSKSSTTEEQFEASKKDELMKQCERDLESGGVMCWRKWMPSRRKNC